jgi:hypothetical protein
MSSSPQNLASLSLHYKDWTWKYYRNLNLTFFTFSAESSRRVFIGGLSQCLGPNWGSGSPHFKPASHITWSGDQALWQHYLCHFGYPFCRLKLTHVEDRFWKGAKPWPSDRLPFGSVRPWLCATSSPHVILSVTMSYFGHNEDMNGFWSIWCFSVVRCFWKGKSTKLVKLVSNKHLSSISWMKCRYVGGKYTHFMNANTPTHTHLEFCSSLSKTKELNPRDISKNSSAITARE